MTTPSYNASPLAPRVRRGGFVLIDPATETVERVIAFQYNPESLSRSLQARGAGEGGDRNEALRLTGPPVESISLEAELDATDQLEFPDDNETVVQVGLHAQLAALESVLYPSLETLVSNHERAARGELEIIPAQAPLVLFVWGRSRVVPVRLSDFSVVEEGFDPDLNPLRVRISVNMTVLSTNDLTFDSRGAGIYRVYHRTREQLAERMPMGAIDDLGLGEIP
ncbi:hypothetical protein [Pelagibius sp.]|uniref:CIS tube protein n=1 Tax=Pelagibius sp. TaxID=1931238 RepID=UPI00262AB02A|nr:hypothetical protein [Pelagibius sp.]